MTSGKIRKASNHMTFQEYATKYPQNAYNNPNAMLTFLVPKTRFMKYVKQAEAEAAFKRMIIAMASGMLMCPNSNIRSVNGLQQ